MVIKYKWHIFAYEQEKKRGNQRTSRRVPKTPERENQSFWHHFRDDRGKNLQTLADLEITAVYRRKVILNIEPEDYSEGPIVDTLNKVGEMWVFGKDVKGREVYIKITLGHPNNSTICISFHIAEHPMTYPFKG